MNSLSLFIYFAGIVANLNSALGFLSVAFGVITVITFIVFGVNLIGSYSDNRLEDHDFKAFDTRAKNWFKTASISFIIVLALNAFIPSKNTMYAIAASQVGEKIITSEQVQGVASESLTALRHWLKEQAAEKVDDTKKDVKDTTSSMKEAVKEKVTETVDAAKSKAKEAVKEAVKKALD